MNILDLRGPDFLMLYLGLLVACGVLGWVLQRALRGSADGPAGGSAALTPYEVAYLAEGPRGAADAAIAALVHRGDLLVKSDKMLRTAPALPKGLSGFERTVYMAVAGNSPARVRRVRHAVTHASEPFADRLMQRGLLLAPGTHLAIRLASALPAMGLVLLGVAKVMVGVQRDRPVLFLIILCFLALLLAGWLLASCPRRTRSGDRQLSKLRDEHAALEATAASSNVGSLGFGDVAMAYALFGPAVLAAGPMLALRDALKSPSSGGTGCGSGCGSSSCGSSCGGGGGGGCGGCGGGGD